ncbi:MAG: BatA and WFA domain-containing protein [Phycisphaeraceae bacterium]
MTFASPLWGAGLAVAVAAAVGAHLLSRRGGRRVRFPAVRFVIASQAEAARWRRLRHWLVVLWRTAAVGLIALAFMQPRWQPTVASGAAGAGEAMGEHVAIIVDRTASMQRSEGGASLFDEARRRAIAQLQSLNPQRDRASVVLLDARPTPLLPEPTGRFDVLIDRLAAVEVTAEHGQLAEALGRVEALHRRLPDEPARPLRVAVFSDGQATQWPGEAWHELAGQAARVRHHAVGGLAGNRAVRRSSIAPAQPVAGQPATVSAEVANYDAAAATVTVALHVTSNGDGEDAGDVVARQTVAVEPWGTASVSFDVTFDEPGMAVVELALVDAADALPADDRAGRFVTVREARPVHLLTRGDVGDATSAAYYVARALRPTVGGDEGDVDEAARRLTGVALNVASPTVLAEAVERFAADAVVVLVEAGALSEAERAGLVAHVRRGGGAVWVADSAATVRALAAIGGPVLPGGEDAVAWGERRVTAGRFDRPVLEVFEGPARSALLRARFERGWSGRLSDDAEALLYFADGSPAAAWSRLGAGRLAVLTASVSPAESDFVRGPAAAPLLHQLVRHLSPGDAAAGADMGVHPGVHPGEAVDLPVAAGQVVVGPGGGVVDEAVLRRVGAPGRYGVREADGAAWRDGVWVTMAEAESDLRPVSADRVREAEREAAVGDMTGEARGAGGEDGVALWPWCVVAGLVLLVMEPAVARR